MKAKNQTDSNMPKTAFAEQTLESLHAELEVLRDVYREMRSEIRNDENKVVENMNFSLAAVGVAIALGSFVSNMQQYFILLLLPFVFFVLAFRLYGNLLGVIQIGGYLSEVVNPRMREIIELLDPNQHDFGSFRIDWEIYKEQMELPFVLRLPISASLFGLHLLFSVVPVIAFVFYKQSSSQPLASIETALLIADGIGIVLLVIYLISFRRVTQRKLSNNRTQRG